MALDWETVTCYCGECQRLFTTMLPADWDGSVVVCQWCGELDAVVSRQ